MRPNDGADNIVSVFDTGHPVSHRLVDRIPECSGAAFDWPNFCSHQSHAKDIGFLAANVFGTHVNDARQAEMSTSGSRRDAMLACPCFRNDSGLLHPQCQQCLSERVVDLMGTRVIQILPLEPDLGPAQLLTESFCVVQR